MQSNHGKSLSVLTVHDEYNMIDELYVMDEYEDGIGRAPPGWEIATFYLKCEMGLLVSLCGFSENFVQSKAIAL